MIVVDDDEAANGIIHNQTNHTIIYDAITVMIVDESVNKDNGTSIIGSEGNDDNCTVIVNARVNEDEGKGTSNTDTGIVSIDEYDLKDDDQNKGNDGDDTIIVDVIYSIDSEGNKGQVTITNTAYMDVEEAAFLQAKVIVGKSLDQGAHNVIGDWEFSLASQPIKSTSVE